MTTLFVGPSGKAIAVIWDRTRLLGLSCWRLALVAAIGGLSFCSWWFWHARSTGGPDRTGLEVEVSALDFGEVWEQEDFQWELPIYNNSAESIEIAEFGSSCGCFSVTPSSLAIPSNEFRSIRLCFDLKLNDQERRSLSSTPVRFTLRPKVTSHLLRSLAWDIRGKVRSIFTELPTGLDFGDACVHGKPSPTRAFCCTSRVPLETMVAESDLSAATCEVVCTDDDHRSFEVGVTPWSDLPVGPFDFSVRLVAVDREGNRLPAVRVEVSGEKVQDVALTPRLLVLGALRIGEAADHRVCLRSRTGQPFTVSPIVSSESGVKVVDSGHDSDTCDASYQVLLQAAMAGPQRVDVVFRISGGSDSYEARLPVVYHGFPGPQKLHAGVREEPPQVHQSR